MRFIILLSLFLSGCSLCALKFPLDAKAQGWCNRKKLADDFCENDFNKPAESVGYGSVECQTKKE